MPARRGLNPWIEKLIESYDSDRGLRTGGLQAYVVHVGDMSPSQALGSEGPTALLFLSDEHVQIPAVLTAQAWEELQDDQDLECFRSLLGHSVCITDYRLLFHMSTEQTRSHFYLSVGKLGTRAVVDINYNIPSCSTLSSVQTKICQTWRAMLGQYDSQKNQSGLDLTDLLGEWQQDCLQTELEHVQKVLSAPPETSTSTFTSSTVLPEPYTVTSWDKDRIHYKRSKSFTVPGPFLLTPDTLRQLNAQPLTHPQSVGPEITNNHMSCNEVTTEQQSPSEHSVSAWEDAPAVLKGASINYMSNVWDMHPPPSNTSSTKSSPQVSPVRQSLVFTESTSNMLLVDTSTQVSAPSKESQKELPAEELASLLPAYQRPPAHAPPSTSENVDINSCSTAQEMAKEQLIRKCSRSLRKSGAPSPEDVMVILENDEEDPVGSSPPSWMFDSLTGSTSEQTVSQTWGPPDGALAEVHRHVHDDGRPFSYIYQVKGLELQQLSRFTVGQDLLQWAVRYLLRPQEHNGTISTPQVTDSHVTMS